MSVMDQYAAWKTKLADDLDAVLKDEVGPAVAEALHDEIHERVYDAYAPKYNHRRKDNGGLSDVRNMEIEVYEGTPGEHVLQVTDVTKTQSGDYDLVPIVEEGLEEFHMPFERPFIKETKEKVLKEGIFRDKILSGMAAKGYEIG